MNNFNLQAKFSPAGDQGQAIDKLTKGVEQGLAHQTLLGVTGSGKTFSMANVIQNIQKPTLILAHNKTLAAQLYGEFKAFFPDNAVEYFVSYYDYYQPEAYIPRRDIYIAKESTINEAIERYRNAATQALLTRKDTIIVASVSCIYGLGNPTDYLSLSRELKVGESYQRSKLLLHLSDMQYERSEYDFYPGVFRVRGEIVDIYLASESQALRVEYFGDEIDNLAIINPVTGEVIDRVEEYQIFPAKHFVTPFESLKAVIPQIQADLKLEVQAMKDRGKEIEAFRLQERVSYDLEMLEQVGYCAGIENYSRYIDKRKPGSPPSTLLDYFPDDWLIFVDESHITLPQVKGMYMGDKARKQTLVDYGFRLQAAVDNRPLKREEFFERINQAIYVSATPTDFELELSNSSAKLHKSQGYNGVVEQIIRPTGLLDPKIDVRLANAFKLEQLKADILSHKYTAMSPAASNYQHENQIDNLLAEINTTVKKGQRVLVTTLTKRMAEELTTFMEEIAIKVQYIHSDVDTVERVEILKDLRLGKYDVLVGVNLLREGLDLPEVSLIAILDADKEGYLRSRSSLIQIIGRAARHEEGRVIMYADRITGSMAQTIDETKRRRLLQEEYNAKHGIIPKTIRKEINTILIGKKKEDKNEKDNKEKDLIVTRAQAYAALNKKERKQLLQDIETQMLIFADMQDFERAAEMRDLLTELKKR